MSHQCDSEADGEASVKAWGPLRNDDAVKVIDLDESDEDIAAPSSLPAHRLPANRPDVQDTEAYDVKEEVKCEWKSGEVRSAGEWILTLRKDSTVEWNAAWLRKVGKSEDQVRRMARSS